MKFAGSKLEKVLCVAVDVIGYTVMTLMIVVSVAAVLTLIAQFTNWWIALAVLFVLLMTIPTCMLLEEIRWWRYRREFRRTRPNWVPMQDWRITVREEQGTWDWGH